MVSILGQHFQTFSSYTCQAIKEVLCILFLFLVFLIDTITGFGDNYTGHKDIFRVPTF